MNLNKMFVFIFVFFIMFSALLVNMPGDFRILGIEAEVQDKEVADFFNAQNVTAYNNTLSFNMTFPEDQQFDFGLPEGEKLMFWWYHLPAWGDCLKLVHLTDNFWGWWWGQHDLSVQEPYASKVVDPVALRKDDILALFDEDYNASYMEWSCDHINMKLFVLTYNQSWTLEESWDNGKLKLFSSYSIDWTATGTSMWGVMGQLLAFQNPQLGIPGVGGTILSVGFGGVLWASIVLLFFALITSVIPWIRGWVGGGGG